MYGIIDIGSNTMRLSCYRVVDRELVPMFHKKMMAGLAGYVDENQCLSEDGINIAIETLKDFYKIVLCIGFDRVYVIATASFRNVENTKDIVAQIKEATGIDVEVLSGKQEALYDFKGATHNVVAKHGIVVDIGGGSTEIVCFNEGNVESATSLPIGSLNTFSKYVSELFPTDDEEKKIRQQVKKQLEQLSVTKHSFMLGVGGSTRACMKLYNSYYKLDSSNVEMNCTMLTELLANMGSGQIVDMKKILKIVPDRIHTIIPGMIVLDEIAKAYESKTIHLSSWGVREGYLIENVL